MNVNPLLDDVYYFFFILFSRSLSHSLFFLSFFIFARLHPIGRFYLSVLSSHLLWCLNRMKMEMRFFFFFYASFFVSSCSHLKGRKFSAYSFFISVIYMRALKDDARFDLFDRLIVYMHEKAKNLYR